MEFVTPAGFGLRWPDMSLSELTSNAHASEPSSASLIKRLQARDPQAWRRFTVIYGPLVLGWSRRAGLQQSDAEDVVQETFQSVATHVSDFRRDRGGDSFRGWLWTIARSKLHDHFRRQGRQPAAAGGSAAYRRLEELTEGPPTDLAGQEEMASVTRRALSIIQTDFQDSTWRAFWRTAIDRQPAAAVAAELGISVAAVYMARSRVLVRLRQELDEAFD
jgi:RNA polymerase sigma-70 factor (ECF subfamily)